MMIVDANNREEWDGFVKSRIEANFLHSWDYGEFITARGKTIVRRLVVVEEKIVGAWEGVVETARRGKYMAIAGGPIMDYSKKSMVRAVFDDIRAQGEQLGCVFVRVRPQIEKTEKAFSLFKEMGLRRAPMYLSVEFAGILDLEKSEEEILAGASQRLRRSLRKAEKAGVTVDKSTDVADIKGFYKIQEETARRQGFVVFSEEYLTKQFDAFAKNGEAVLYTARHEGEILAQNFMIFYGAEASYHYGVSTEAGTRISGAPKLHIEAMRDARERGQKRYNFWGIVEEDETDHRFYGVSVFKRGFGVEELRYLPAHDLVLKPIAYRANLAVETIRRQKRHV